MSSNGINKAIVIGRLGADPELRQTQTGNAFCTLSLATSEAWKDKTSGEPKERTEWHRVVFWGRLAEIAAQYLAKGSRIYIEGPLRTRKWTDQNGQDRYTTEIHAQQMQMLDGKASGEASSRPQTAAQPNQTQPPPSFNESADFDDDIPF
ncbi:MAG: single-stranded DNA-binding protein [Lamprobacter sp.]|uniref:single-stranded DNA-binding protein n=1 Tax=Lamprobacter sp. TaxID=3100796 RepID=UPI002B26413D|nr:single-stranded DNA-binding protein [Lamprobacter sp.]MEA3643361.1 single-stranded DNA-binding protein [Lamprobacter sp.]